MAMIAGPVDAVLEATEGGGESAPPLDIRAALGRGIYHERYCESAARRAARARRIASPLASVR
ncbi:hypothetical protein [Methylocystis sp. S23]